MSGRQGTQIARGHVELADALRVALRGDRRTANAFAPLIAAAAVDYREAMRHRDGERVTAARSADFADQIERAAAKCLRVLETLRPRIDDALRKHYLPGTATFASGTLATLAGFGLRAQSENVRTDWEAREMAVGGLADVVVQSRKWATIARRLGSRGRGRPVGIRPTLAAYVAIRLRDRGVRLTKSRTGKFASVLKIAYEEAGIRIGDVGRDVTRTVNRLKASQAKVQKSGETD